MKIVECKQLSAEWFAQRCGKVTGSHIVDVLDRRKDGADAAARAAYKSRLIAEILTGNPYEGNFVSEEMRWGIEQESSARAEYEVRRELMVEQVGLVLHPEIERASCSPDGLVGEEGGLEIKCPKTSTHIKWMLAGVVPPEHEPQMAFCMACTGRHWWDFASYDPRLPRRYQFFTVRLPRDQKRIAEINYAAVEFLAEVDAIIARLNEIAPAGQGASHPFTFLSLRC